MADIADLGVVSASEKGADLTIRHPGTGEETDIVFSVLGYDAESVVQAGRAFDRKEAEKPAQDRADAFQRRQVATAIAAVTGWKNLTMGGKDVPYSATKAREILGDPNYIWIVTQIGNFGGSRRNFLPSKPTD